jgi:tRNA pseudouridine55 synthase
MLPLCFGEATKVCAFLLDADKTYRVTARLGIATDTGDADGNEIGQAEVPRLESDEWDRILQGFLGETTQIPPMYSALKKDGKRLYELARKGETVDREPRPVRIDWIELLEAAGTRLVFRVHCSKGTYVRTLVEDIAAKAGTLAHTARLHRESVGHFEPSAMLSLREAESLLEQGREQLTGRLLAADVALTSMGEVRLDDAAGQRFGSGLEVSAPTGAQAGLVRVYGPGGSRDFLGVGEVAGVDRVAPKRVFQRQ